MSRFNKIVVIGQVQNNPSSKETPNGDTVTTFLLDVSRPPQENMPQQSDTFTIVCWRDLAIKMSTLTEGSTLLVEGSIRNNSFENSNGQRVYKTEIEARDIKNLNVSQANQPKTEHPNSTPTSSSIPVIETPSGETKTDSFDFNEAIKSPSNDPVFSTEIGEDVPF